MDLLLWLGRPARSPNCGVGGGGRSGAEGGSTLSPKLASSGVLANSVMVGLAGDVGEAGYEPGRCCAWRFELLVFSGSRSRDVFCRFRGRVGMWEALLETLASQEPLDTAAGWVP